jgi:hypothetical protein
VRGKVAPIWGEKFSIVFAPYSIDFRTINGRTKISRNIHLAPNPTVAGSYRRAPNFEKYTSGTKPHGGRFLPPCSKFREIYIWHQTPRWQVPTAVLQISRYTSGTKPHGGRFLPPCSTALSPCRHGARWQDSTSGGRAARHGATTLPPSVRSLPSCHTALDLF